MAAQTQADESSDAPEQAPEAEACTDQDRLIRNYMLGSMAVCFIPAPALDFAAITAIQLKMVCDLAEAHGVPYKENLGRSLIFSLVGTLGAGHLSVGVVGSFMKIIPGVGHLAAALTMPVMVGAATYALGRVFKLHFETGGTLLDFDVEAMRSHFKEEYENGVGVAKKSKAKAKAKASA